MSQGYYQGVNNSSSEALPPGPGLASEANKAPGSRRKWIIVSAVVGVIALIALGVGLGVGLTRTSNNSSASGSSSSSSNSDSDSDSGSSSGSNPGSVDPEASSFTKDPNLHKSFYGLSYTPEGSLLPECGNSLDAVIKDIQLISQLTTRIRLYGADCNQSALVLDAIQKTGTDVQVWLGNYVLPDDDAVYERQRDLIRDAISTYGTKHIAGVTVGNEFMLNYLISNGATDPDSAIGNQGATILQGYITDTRNMLAEMSVDLPVGTSDAGSFFNTQVLSSVDFGLSNVHPWFANTTIENAAAWTSTFFDEENVQVAAALPNQPTMYIAETGWPTQSSDLANANNGAADASIANLQVFLDTFVCQANTAGTRYFYFEFSDEPWKDVQFGGVEGWWGLFNHDRTLKSVTIPDCEAP